MQQPDLLGILPQNIFNGKYHSGKTNSFHGEITVLPFTCCVVGFLFILFYFWSVQQKAPHFKELSYRCRSGKKTFQRGRNLTGFNLELDCFIKGIM